MNEKKKSVLVVDDEPKIVEVISRFLESRGFLVHTAASGEEALRIFRQEEFSLVLLDLMLPGLSGEEVCARIRQNSSTPIIMLTAKTLEADQLRGLQLGADDYIVKPFSLALLGARVEAVLRRAGDALASPGQKRSFQSGDLVIDLASWEITKGGQAVSLTPNEFKILATLMKYPNKVFTREELISLALGDDFDGYERAVDGHVKNIRQKLETDPKNPVYIRTVHGVGYKFGGESG